MVVYILCIKIDDKNHEMTSLQLYTPQRYFTVFVCSESQHQLEYTLVRTPSIRRKQRQTVKASEGIKKDTYSDGVIIYATVSEKSVI